MYLAIFETILNGDPDPEGKMNFNPSGSTALFETLVFVTQLFCFQDNPDALGLLIYSDELETCNPLGASKGIHKILNVYVSFAEISKCDRYGTYVTQIKNTFFFLKGPIITSGVKPN